MHFLQAQNCLAAIINDFGASTQQYFWRLSGEKPNSLCKFLGRNEEDVKAVLRMCFIYRGPLDKINRKNFENLMSICGCQSTKYNMEYDIAIGEGVGRISRKNYYPDGKLHFFPTPDIHFYILPRGRLQHKGFAERGQEKGSKRRLFLPLRIRERLDSFPIFCDECGTVCGIAGIAIKSCADFDELDGNDHNQVVEGI
jgi:hypothetical protein